ncbi:MAG: hypothetical protein QE265_09980 [Rhodoferax sp.]|nr:hypothetical protein [Rhodoferax sp.]
MQQIDHRVIKLIVGVIAIFLALFMQVASGELLDSISASYHTRARDWFVGLLFAVAALFLSFKGETGNHGRERKLTLFASLCALLVAVAPCACGRTASAISAFHYLGATGVFVVMGYFCWRFRKTATDKIDKYPEAKNRVNVYTACLLGMILCGTMAIWYLLAKILNYPVFTTYLFWVEAIGLFSFGVSWLAASRIFPMITNSQERFHLLEGRAKEDIAESTTTR